MTKTWIIIDDKAGNANQAIAVANALGEAYEIKKLEYNFWAFLPNMLKFNSLIGVKKNLSSNLSPPYPDLIISSGRRAAAVSNYIKKHNKECYVTHLMHPDLPFENFDLVCLPLHDFKESYKQFKNILYTIGAPSWFDTKLLKAKGNSFKDKLSIEPPFVSLILGGKNKQGEYSLQEYEWLAKKANLLAQEIGASLLITNSRRTSRDILSNILQYIEVPYFLFDWHSPFNQENPYLAFLNLSDYFIITGDSISICSDALTTGKPIYIYRNDELLSKKHRKFLDYLSEVGYTKTLCEETTELLKWRYSPLQEAERVCQFIRDRGNVINTTFPI